MPVNSFEDYPMSWKPDIDSLKRPIYQSLADQLERDIARGLLVPDTKLPPQRELADYLDINFTTVTRAYRIAELKGLIYAVTGRGTFVSPSVVGSEAVMAQEVPRGIIDLAPVSSYEQTNGTILECAGRVLQKNYADRLLNYYNPFGMMHQIAAGVNWVKQFGIETDTDHLILTTGAQNAIGTSLMALFEAGDRIAVEEFSYSNFMGIAKRLRLQLVPVPGDSKGMNPGALEAACRNKSVKGVFLMPTCANPTSIMTSPIRRRALAQVIRHYDLKVIEDDAYAFISLDDKRLSCDPMFNLLPERTVYLASVSKPICSGLRVAYMIYPSEYKKILETAYTDLNIKTPSLDAEIATEAILSGDAYKVMAVKLALARKSNEIFDSVFGGNICQGHPNSLFKWLPIEDEGDFRLTEKLLLDKGVKAFHSERFLGGRYRPDHYLRISLTSAKDLKDLKTGLEIIRDNIKVRQIYSA